ncbi:glycosyltransferase family 9 protein [Leptolyngbya sp. AN02str]|uniref:glycosyltransferase family 9 protein n=1 Tax=Leptolyngbya sp. AN02str TaxID=3423363 RepID=UPI003D3162F1
MKIVALVPGGVRDQLQVFPTLDTLKTVYPNAEIDVVIEPGAMSAYRISKSVSDTIAFAYGNNNSPADWANLLGVLRDRTYDIALVFRPAWGLGFLLWLTGIPLRVAFGSGSGGLFYTKTVPFAASQYAPAAYHDLLTALDVSTPSPHLAISLSKRDLDWADAEQKRLGIGGGGYVLLHNDATEPYPVESWKAIIQDFQQKQPTLPLMMIQDEQNGATVAAIAQAEPAIKISAPPDLGKLAAMVAGANLVLCTDGIPMQLAVALQVYTLGLFGATNPALALPASDKYLPIQAPNSNLAELPPQTVMQKVWGG